MNGGKDDEIVARDDFEESLEALTITTTDEDSEEGPRHKKKKRKIACAECDKTSGTEGEVEADAKQGHLVCKKCGHIANVRLFYCCKCCIRTCARCRNWSWSMILSGKAHTSRTTRKPF